MAEARAEAKEIVEEAKAYADASIRKYQKWEKNPAKADNKAMERERTALRERAKSYETKQKKKKRTSGHAPEDFKLGDTVRILSMDTTGTVTDLPNAKGEIGITAGILHMNRPISDCEIIDAPAEAPTMNPYASRKSRQSMNLDRAKHISAEINVIGATVDEAVARIDQYLDDALLANLDRITIIHGKGTGALRNGIHNYLKSQSHVAAYRSGEFGEGDMGVTVVELQ